MRFEILTASPAEQRADCLVVGLHEEDELPPSTKAVNQRTRGHIRALRARGDAPTRLAETLMVLDPPELRSPRLLLVGLGPRKNFDKRAWRRAVSAALAAVLRTRATSAVLAIDGPAATQMDDYYFGRAVAELTGAALYRINDLKSGKKPRPYALASIKAGPINAAAAAQARRGLAHGAAIADGMKMLRDLGNLPGNVCTPRYLAARAKQIAGTYRSVRARIHDEAAIRRLKMGCLLAVAQGSDEPPRFIVLEHRGGRAGAAPVVLVGKGVTFDTGGISLKDPGAMDEMKYDMCGAASVLAAVSVAAALKLPINVVGLVASVENMPSGGAIKPGDIVTSASGQTVEILNTDAEGRLILCDALDYARRYKPAAVIDIATLTGACVVALGHHFTGVMGNDDHLA
ncbi:MAG: leucyl aminopeptidase, partial [Steroidobacteraceae bacterium]